MKNILKQCVVWLLSCAFGVLGGYVYAYWHAAKMEKVPVLRSSRFELTDSTGRVIAFWGTDRGNNTVLAFLRKASQDMVSLRIPGSAWPTSFTAQNPNEALAVGMMSTQVPFMNLQAGDGSSRAMLYLSEYQKPVFIMSDEHYEGRLILGFISNDAPSPGDDDWALSVRGPDVAGIGSIKDPVDRKYKGFLSVARNPQIR
jgi:hypothetical protein